MVFITLNNSLFSALSTYSITRLLMTMANNKTTNQPGSNDKQPHEERTRNQEAHDTSFTRPNGERTMQESNKSKQEPEEDHNPATNGKTKSELAEERGGHGHSGHSNSRKGSRKS